MGMPVWRLKHPCESCAAGYGVCIQGLSAGLQCCADCEHPGRWTQHPYTQSEMEEMTRKE